MSGWLIVVAALALLVVMKRLWFRWFSHRPLTSTDDYAVAVDTAVDDATDPRARPTPPLPPDAVGSGASTPVPGLTAGLPDLPWTAAARRPSQSRREPAVGQRFIPTQRGAGDERAAVEDRAAIPPGV